MADRTTRSRRAPLGVALIVAIAALASVTVWATGTTSQPPRPIPSQPITIDGLRATKVTLYLNVSWSGVEPALRDDVAKALAIAGLHGCAPNPPDTSSMPIAPGFFCSTDSSFDDTSLGTLEQLPHVADVFGSVGHHGADLYFLGVRRGEPALVVEPGSPQRTQHDLAVLRSVAGVLHCGSADLGEMLSDIIACATISRGAASHAQRAAYHLNVSYAEVFASY
jgi:hypothetical protein